MTMLSWDYAECGADTQWLRSKKQGKCTAELRREIFAMSNQLQTEVRDAQKLRHAISRELGAGCRMEDAESD